MDIAIEKCVIIFRKKKVLWEELMLCFGEFEIEIEENGKIQLPDKILDNQTFLRGTLLKFVSFPNHYALYSLEEWGNAIVELNKATIEEIKELFGEDLFEAKIRRDNLGGCYGEVDIEIEEDGAIQLPNTVLANKEFKPSSSIILVGVITHYEIFSFDEWEEEMKIDNEYISDLMEKYELEE